MSIEISSGSIYQKKKRKTLDSDFLSRKILRINLFVMYPRNVSSLWTRLMLYTNTCLHSSILLKLY